MVQMNDFPDEILEQILFNVSPYGDLDNCALVCRRWERIVHSVSRLTYLGLMRGLRDTRTLRWRPDASNNSTPPVGDYNPLIQSYNLLATRPRAPSIAPRFSHAAIVHDNSMYVFGGGSASSTTFNDLWRFDLSTRQWHRPLSTGVYPTPKACPSLVAHGGRLIVFGGWRHPSANQVYQSWRLFNELHVYHIAERRWSVHSPPESGANGSPPSPMLRGAQAPVRTYPPPMTGHSATVHGGQMVVFGGFQKLTLVPQPDPEDEIGRNLQMMMGGLIHDEEESMTGCSNSVWLLDLETFAWKLQPTTALKPPARYGQCQVRLGEERLLVLGGCGGPNNMFSDAWVLEMSEPVWQWRPVRMENARCASSYMWCNPSCRVGSKLVMLGPTSATPSDLHLMNPTGANMRQPQPPARANAPQPPDDQPVQRLLERPEPNIRPLPSPPTPPPQAPLSPARVAAAVAAAAAQYLPPAAPQALQPAAPVHRSPQQICEEANRRLQEERNRRSPGSSAKSPSQQPSHSRHSRPGPSSGVLVRRCDRRSSDNDADDEEAVNRRLKRNLQLKSRGSDDDADQFLPKRFNQPGGAAAEPALGMAAFNVPEAAGGAGGAMGSATGASAPPIGLQPRQHERRLENLRRIEEKMRAKQQEMLQQQLQQQQQQHQQQQQAVARRPFMRDEGDSSDGDVDADDDDLFPRNPPRDDILLVAPAAAELPAAVPLLEALERSPARGARRATNSIGVFVCDISALLADGAQTDEELLNTPLADLQRPAAQPTATLPTTSTNSTTPAADADGLVMRWLHNPNGGLIDGAPERLILSSLVAGNGELIMFGGLRKESMANAATISEVSNGLHFLTFPRGLL